MHEEGEEKGTEEPRRKAPTRGGQRSRSGGQQQWEHKKKLHLLLKTTG